MWSVADWYREYQLPGVPGSSQREHIDGCCVTLLVPFVLFSLGVFSPTLLRDRLLGPYQLSHQAAQLLTGRRWRPLNL